MTDIRALLKRLQNRADRSKDAERGFSLIELIIVIVILGILVAIAIPVYNNIQNKAKTNALQTAASNGASQAAADFASGDDATAVSTNLAKLKKGDIDSVVLTSGTSADDVCVTAKNSDGETATAGPGCPS